VEARTLEQRIKFDHGLTVGENLVLFTHGDRSRKALVRIGQKGKVTAFTEPDECEMYSSWFQVKGDTTRAIGDVFVWPWKDAELMARFAPEPAAVIPLTVQS
jgi:uncharacterized Ntn-hydrolase superfamily protein